MPNVLNEFTGDGVTRTFNFAMTGGYLSRDYVYFFTRPNADLLNYTPYNDDDVTWISDYTVRTAVPIPEGTTFVVVRATPLDPLVDFQNTSRITEKNLDTATWQSVHIAAETSDTVGRIQVVAQDAKQESAQALADAQAAAADAATAATSAIAASAAASAAQVSALQAGGDASDAALSAATAVGVADAAALTANAANVTAIAASADAASALTSAGNANYTAGSAASQAGTAVNTANTALTTANAASTAAGNAVTTANSAAATASTAMTIANEAKDLVDGAVAGAVVAFNGRSGTVTPQAGDYTKAMVGLGNVDNTPDLEKPISTATSNALGLKADKSYVDTQLATKADSTSVTNALALKADTTAMNTALAANAAADRNRANHTGMQSPSTITGLDAWLTNPSGVQSINGSAVSASRNMIVNGAMLVAHEGPSAGTVAGHYAVDCYATTVNPPSTHAVTGSRTVLGVNRPAVGINNAARITVNSIGAVTAQHYATLNHRVEGNNMLRAIDTPTTISFYVRGSKPGTGAFALRSGKSNRALLMSYPITTAWTRVVLQMPTGLPATWLVDPSVGSTGDDLGLQVCWTFLCGSDFRNATTGSWVNGNFLAPTTGGNYFTTAGDWAEVTGVQMEQGLGATAYEVEALQDTLIKVNRYVYLCDRFGMYVFQNGGPWQGALANITFPIRMCRPPTSTILWMEGGAGAATVSSVSHSSAQVSLVNPTSVSAYGIYSGFFRAYPN